MDALSLEAQLVDAMRDGLAVFDGKGNLVRWNSSGDAALASPRTRAMRRTSTFLFKVANMGVRAAKLAGGGCYRDGTVGADTRPVIKTEVSAWASSPS